MQHGLFMQYHLENIRDIVFFMLYMLGKDSFPDGSRCIYLSLLVYLLVLLSF